jgi:hypothetical protein
MKTLFSNCRAMKSRVHSLIYLAALPLTVGLAACAAPQPNANAQTVAPAAAPQITPKTLRVYFVGNSVTDTIRYESLQKLAESRGHKHVSGRHMIPGAPLDWIWTHGDGGFQNEPFGHYPKALPGFAWDAISLQPFDRQIDGDTEHIGKYIALARQNPENAQTQFYIYARWPRMSKNGKGVEYDKNNFGKDGDDPKKITDYSTIDAWDKLWSAKYTGGWDNTNEGADYFESLTRAVQKAHPKLEKPVVMVPVGHAMAALDKKMQAGQVPGFKNIWDVYADGIHLNKVGAYIVACTYYATLYKESPVGLSGEPYAVTDSKLASTIQETVWEVVKSHPLAGIATPEK